MRSLASPLVANILRALERNSPFLVGELCALEFNEAVLILDAFLSAAATDPSIIAGAPGETDALPDTLLKRLADLLLPTPGDSDLSEAGFELSPSDSDKWGQISAQVLAPSVS